MQSTIFDTVTPLNVYADVVLPIPVQQTFTYQVPEHLVNKIIVGCRVIVQFGNRKIFSALVKKIHNNIPLYETKPIEIVLDESPIVFDKQLLFWEWLASYYLCSEGEVMKAALPSGLKLESQTTICLNTEWLQTAPLSDSEEVVFQFIQTNKSATIQQVNSLTRRSNAFPIIKNLFQKGAITVDETISESYKPKTISHIRINPLFDNEEKINEILNTLSKAKKQQELLMFLIHELNIFTSEKKSLIPKKELLQKSNASDATLKSLLDKGIIEVVDVETDRIIAKHATTETNQLNQYQEKAFSEIKNQLNEKNVTLLYGVTASGKTEIYIKLIEEQLNMGKQVLYLLPEIALTTQITERLTSVFGRKAGVYHSKYNDAERIEIWNKVLAFNYESNNQHQLILGARSSLFLPYSNLGLIIVDEEHETSYKQFDPAPRYHARDAAIVLASIHNAKVLLGTATPSFESYFNVKAKKYGYVELLQKHHDVEMPDIIVADIKDAYKRKTMKSHFTPLLINEIEKALENNEQIILFQNRRGFSPFIQCRNCGWIPKCKHCDVSLTYHKYYNNLQCHYCGFTQSLTSHCTDCNSTDVQTKGFGTEKIEDDLSIYFPNVKVGRLDLDSTKTKLGFNNIIQKFTDGKTQILVGTQMVTKGLDFENVSLVGILNADNLLNFPDFRAYERAYQLMAQVSGRAGRKNKKGKVVIQTSQPEHPIISLVIKNNYEQMFNMFINERNLFRYPPWYRLINITVKHKDKDRAEKVSQQLANELRKSFHSRILGPEYHLVSRMQQYYQLIIRIKIERNLPSTKAKETILLAIERVKQFKNNSAVIFSLDVDPY